MSIRSLAAAARGLALAALVLVGAGCATRSETVVLLPEQDGRDTAVIVKSGDGDVVLDKPYEALTRNRLRQRTYTATPDEVKATFGGALAAQPARVASFTLLFVENKDELTDESKRVVESVFSEIALRPVPDILVIGHTDTVGSDAVNDALALQRAEAIRRELIRRGVAAENVQASGRGKRELAVRTADNVSEPRNRRVVIEVR